MSDPATRASGCIGTMDGWMLIRTSHTKIDGTEVQLEWGVGYQIPNQNAGPLEVFLVHQKEPNEKLFKYLDGYWQVDDVHHPAKTPELILEQINVQLTHFHGAVEPILPHLRDRVQKMLECWVDLNPKGDE